MSIAVVVVVVVIVVLTSTGRYNAVRDHRAGSNRSGVEDYLRRKIIQLVVYQSNLYY